ncbi:hypothetical protein Pelo_4021 [Pelomyxa schiedti]|nr:hypothetical protein Pelo_4021 [Pelomyxa schiedti]
MKYLHNQRSQYHSKEQRHNWQLQRVLLQPIVLPPDFFGPDVPIELPIEPEIPAVTPVETVRSNDKGSQEVPEEPKKHHKSVKDTSLPWPGSKSKAKEAEKPRQGRPVNILPSKPVGSTVGQSPSKSQGVSIPESVPPRKFTKHHESIKTVVTSPQHPPPVGVAKVVRADIRSSTQLVIPPVQGPVTSTTTTTATSQRVVEGDSAKNGGANKLQNTVRQHQSPQDRNPSTTTQLESQAMALAQAQLQPRRRPGRPRGSTNKEIPPLCSRSLHQDLHLLGIPCASSSTFWGYDCCSVLIHCALDLNKQTERCPRKLDDLLPVASAITLHGSELCRIDENRSRIMPNAGYS